MRLSHLLLAVPLALGCSSTPDAYTKAKSAGDRAKSGGRYDEAARSYHEAALAAKKPHDRDEARYLEAATLARAGRVEEAKRVLEAITTEAPKGDRADRAAFDRAFLEIERGDEQAGWAALEKALFERPFGGLARRPLAKIVQHEEQKAKGGGLAWLDAHMPQLAKTELSEDAAYMRAGLLREAGRVREARDAYVRCAEEHPYPKGSLTDDSFWHAAEIDLELGDPQKAIEDLRRLIAPREVSSLGQGSYERPRYSPAQMRIAEIYRDKLGDARRAREEFRTLYDKFPTSILRGDALFSDAILARKEKDDAGACTIARRLVRDLPDSRYSACSRELCADVAPPEKALPCRAYLRARIDGKPAPSGEPPATDDGS